MNVGSLASTERSASVASACDSPVNDVEDSDTSNRADSGCSAAAGGRGEVCHPAQDPRVRLAITATARSERRIAVRGPPRERSGSRRRVSAAVFEFCSGLVDLVVGVGHHLGGRHRLALAG